MLNFSSKNSVNYINHRLISLNRLFPPRYYLTFASYRASYANHKSRNNFLNKLYFFSSVHLPYCIVSLIETVNIRAALLFITMNITK